MSDITTKVVAGIGVTLAAAVSTIGIYLYLKNDQDDDMATILRHHTSRFTRQRMKRIRVRADAIGAVIGKGGENIKRIQNSTKTRINFEDDICPGEDRYAIITGSDKAVADAEAEIQTIINSQPVLMTNEIFIPYAAAGAVIGRNGDKIRSLCNATGAKIAVEKQMAQPLDGFTLISIKGTVDQIKAAKAAITEVVGKDQVRKDRPDSLARPLLNGKTHLNGSSNKMDNRTNSPPKKLLPMWSLKMQLEADEDLTEFFKENFLDGADSPSSACSYTTEIWDDQLCEELTPTVDGLVHVYVSHVESPSRFWVQLYGPKSTALDKLSSDMTEYYEHNCHKEKVKSLRLGDIVAAPFTTHDETWYRVRVIEIIERHPLDESDVKVYYLDFGGESTQKRKTLCSLKHEFLTALSFQAVECCLDGVLPINDTEWSEDATDYFGAISHASEWIELLARPVEKKNTSETKSVPVDLFDFKEHKERLNLASLMIEKGFARAIECIKDTDT